MVTWEEAPVDQYNPSQKSYVLRVAGILQVWVGPGRYGDWFVTVSGIGGQEVGKLRDVEIAKTVGISVARGLLQQALAELRKVEGQK